MDMLLESYDLMREGHQSIKQYLKGGQKLLVNWIMKSKNNWLGKKH